MASSEVMGDYVFTRFRVKITAPDFYQSRGNKASIKAECVRDCIQQFLNEGAKIDPTFALAPWSLKDRESNLRLPNSICPLPTHIDQAKKYYYSINYYSNQPDLYFYFRLRHEISTSLVLNNVVRPFHFSLYLASLQESEDPIKGGFFVYSHRAFATSSTLLQSISSAISLTEGRPIEVAIYWGPINLISLGGPTFYTLQIEVGLSNYDNLKRTLTYIYNQSKTYPLGVPMVYVPPVARCVDKNLILNAGGSQHKFNKIVLALEFRCLLERDLDKKLTVKESPITMHPDKGKLSTLRDLFRFGVMVAGGSVFHSILQCTDYSGDSYILALVMPSGPRVKLARAILQSPVAFFRHCFEEDVLRTLFDKQAMLQGRSDVYDLETQTVINNDEKTANEALRTFFHVDIQFILDSSDDNTNSTQGEAASYSSNFSFDPGSVKTTSALSKRPRFAQDQVPGTSKGVTGEVK